MDRVRAALRFVSSSNAAARLNGLRMLHQMCGHPGERRLVGAGGGVEAILSVLKDLLEDRSGTDRELVYQLRSFGLAALLMALHDAANAKRAVRAGAVSTVGKIIKQMGEAVRGGLGTGTPMVVDGGVLTMEAIAYAFGSLWEMVKLMEAVEILEESGMLPDLLRVGARFDMERDAGQKNVKRRVIGMLAQMGCHSRESNALVASTIVGLWVDPDTLRPRRSVAENAQFSNLLLQWLVSTYSRNSAVHLQRGSPAMATLLRLAEGSPDTTVLRVCCGVLHYMAANPKNRPAFDEDGVPAQLVRILSAAAEGSKIVFTDSETLREAVATLLMAAHHRSHCQAAIEAGVVPVMLRLAVLATGEKTRAWALGFLWEAAKLADGAAQIVDTRIELGLELSLLRPAQRAAVEAILPALQRAGGCGHGVDTLLRLAVFVVSSVRGEMPPPAHDWLSRMFGVCHSLITGTAYPRETFFGRVVSLLLDRSSPLRIRLLVVQVLASMTRSVLFNGLPESQPEVVEFLCGTILAEQPLVRRAGCAMLIGLTVHAENLPGLGTCGAVTAVVSCLKAGFSATEDDVFALRDVLGALLMMARNEGNEARAVMAGALEALLPLTGSADVTIAARAVGSLANLAKNHPDQVATLGENGSGMQVLLAVGANTRAQDLQQRSLSLFATMLKQSTRAQTMFLDAVQRLLDGRDAEQADDHGGGAVGAPASASGDDSDGDDGAGAPAGASGAAAAAPSRSDSGAGAADGANGRVGITLAEAGVLWPSKDAIQQFVRRVFATTWGRSGESLSADLPIIAPVLRDLQDPDVSHSKLADSLSWLQMFLLNNEKTCVALAEKGCVSFLVDAMRRTTRSNGDYGSRAELGMLREGLACLLLMTGAASNRELAVESGALEPVFALTNSDDVTCRKYAIGSLWNIARSFADRVADYGGDPGSCAAVPRLINVSARATDGDTPGRVNGMWQHLLKRNETQAAWINRIRTLLLGADEVNDGVVAADGRHVISPSRDEPTRIENSTCSVCMDEYAADQRVRRLDECGHMYHRDCVLPWLAAHDTCPLCRKHADPSPTMTVQLADRVIAAAWHQDSKECEDVTATSPLVVALVDMCKDDHPAVCTAGCCLMRPLAARAGCRAALITAGAAAALPGVLAHGRGCVGATVPDELLSPHGVPVARLDALQALALLLKHPESLEVAFDSGLVPALFAIIQDEGSPVVPCVVWACVCLSELATMPHARPAIADNGGPCVGLRTLVQIARPSSSRSLLQHVGGLGRLVSTLAQLLRHSALQGVAMANFEDDVLTMWTCLARELTTTDTSFVMPAVVAMARRTMGCTVTDLSMVIEADRLKKAGITFWTAFFAAGSDTTLCVMSQPAIVAEMLVRSADNGAANLHENVVPVIRVDPSRKMLLTPRFVKLGAMLRPTGPWEQFYEARGARDAHFEHYLFRYAADFAEGIAYLHHCGFAHGNLHPDALALTIDPSGRDAARGQVYRFGHAQRAGYGNLNFSGMVGYRAPERVGPRLPMSPHERSLLAKAHNALPGDVYCLGVVLSQLFTGVQLTPPQPPPGQQQTVTHFDARPQVERQLHEWASRHGAATSGPTVVRAMLLKCMLLDPDARPSAEAVARCLRSNTPLLGKECPTPGARCNICRPDLPTTRELQAHFTVRVYICDECHRVTTARSMTCRECDSRPPRVATWVLSERTGPQLDAVSARQEVTMFTCSDCSTVTIGHVSDNFAHPVGCSSQKEFSKGDPPSYSASTVRFAPSALSSLRAAVAKFSRVVTIDGSTGAVEAPPVEREIDAVALAMLDSIPVPSSPEGSSPREDGGGVSAATEEGDAPPSLVPDDRSSVARVAAAGGAGGPSDADDRPCGAPVLPEASQAREESPEVDAATTSADEDATATATFEEAVGSTVTSCDASATAASGGAAATETTQDTAATATSDEAADTATSEDVAAAATGEEAAIEETAATATSEDAAATASSGEAVTPTRDDAVAPQTSEDAVVAATSEEAAAATTSEEATSTPSIVDGAAAATAAAAATRHEATATVTSDGASAAAMSDENAATATSEDVAAAAAGEDVAAAAAGEDFAAAAMSDENAATAASDDGAAPVTGEEAASEDAAAAATSEDAAAATTSEGAVTATREGATAPRTSEATGDETAVTTTSEVTTFAPTSVDGAAAATIEAAATAPSESTIVTAASEDAAATEADEDAVATTAAGGGAGATTAAGGGAGATTAAGGGAGGSIRATTDGGTDGAAAHPSQSPDVLQEPLVAGTRDRESHGGLRRRGAAQGRHAATTSVGTQAAAERGSSQVTSEEGRSLERLHSNVVLFTVVGAICFLAGFSVARAVYA